VARVVLDARKMKPWVGINTIVEFLGQRVVAHASASKFDIEVEHNAKAFIIGNALFQHIHTHRAVYHQLQLLAVFKQSI